jgi:geranylgeranyl reductase family protein
MQETNYHTEVAIIGAGPAGMTAALFLSKLGVDCVLAEKGVFPRDKICGDGISGWVVETLTALDPSLVSELARQPFQVPSWGMSVFAPNGKRMDVPFREKKETAGEIPPGFVARRMDFDNFLAGTVRQQPRITFLEGFGVSDFDIRKEEALLYGGGNGATIRAKVLIFADGAPSALSGRLKDTRSGRDRMLIGLRIYYSGITGLHPDHFIELHFLEDLLPGYLWIFPLPGGAANVGIALEQKCIRKYGMSLKKKLADCLIKDKELAGRFARAVPAGNHEAQVLPAWSGRRPLSGERYLLTGDAAVLADPLTGEGIGHAVVSGRLAAHQAARCLEKKDFSAAFLHAYDNELYGIIGKELMLSKKIRQLMKHPRLINAVFDRASNRPALRQALVSSITSLDARKTLKSPWFYIRNLL